MTEQAVLAGLLDDTHRRFLAGDRLQVLVAAMWCGKYGAPLPAWVT